MIAQAFEDLSQALRVLLEARFRFHQLFTVDFPEAVGNVENGLTGVLNAFHSLYDSMAKAGISSRVDWYRSPELCTILAIRNARHHNLCHKIRTIFSYHLDTVNPPTQKQKYLMIDFAFSEDNATAIDVPLSLSDLDQLISLPQKVSKLRGGSCELISAYLNSKSAVDYATSHGLDIAHVFFNVIPLIVNAGIAVHPHIKDHITHKSTESEHFDFHFREVLPANTNNHKYEIFDFWQP